MYGQSFWYLQLGGNFCEIGSTSPGFQGFHNRGPGLHCIQDTSPGFQGVHNKGVTLYTGHLTRFPRKVIITVSSKALLLPRENYLPLSMMSVRAPSCALAYTN